MAIIKPCVRLILKNDCFYHYSGKALTLGVPEIYAAETELRSWFPSLVKKEFPLSPKEITITSNEIGRSLGWISAQNFLHSLGYTEILSLDIDGSEYHPDLVHDLNKPVEDELADQFDLVLDPGTTEHIFDIKTALSSIVKVLKVGGIVIHQVPVYSFNGGYYSINPNVLNDFYTSNGFSDLKTYIIMWDRYRAYFGKHRCYEYSEQVLGERHSLADYDQCRFSPHMLFFAKKVADNTSIKMPLQFSGNYLTGIGGIKDDMASSVLTDTLNSAKFILKPIVPPRVFYFLFAMARRWLFLYKSRRQSFWI